MAILSDAEKEAIAQKMIPRVQRWAGHAARGDVGLAEDLEDCGMEEVAQRLQAFDPGRGCSFSTYAYRGIIGAMMDYLRRWHSTRDLCESLEALPEDALPAEDDVEADAFLGLGKGIIARYVPRLSPVHQWAVESYYAGLGEDELVRSAQDAGFGHYTPATLSRQIYKASDALRRMITRDCARPTSYGRAPELTPT